MIAEAKVLSDNLNLCDNSRDRMFARTEITGGYDAYVDDNGVTQFGEVLFKKSNMIVYGGSLFTIQKVFGLPTDNPLSSGYLDSEYNMTPAVDAGNNESLVGVANKLEYTLNSSFVDITIVKINNIIINSNRYKFNPINKKLTFNSTTIASGDTISVTGVTIDDFAATNVCLFGVGNGGSGDTYSSVKEVYYSDDDISTKLLPFRRVGSANNLLKESDNKYWFKGLDVTVSAGTGTSAVSTTKDEYYLKSIETKVIKVQNDSGESIVSADSLPNASQPNSTANTFVELKLVIDSTNQSTGDLHEYYKDTGDIEHARYNSIGLFTGVKKKIGTVDGVDIFDYRNVRLFSKLNIENEMLTSSKQLTITYKIYTT